MPDSSLAFIFPAFANDYTDHPGTRIAGFTEHFNKLLLTASTGPEPALAGFSFEKCNFLDSELLTQFITYIYSCAASQTLRESGIKPVCTAGYSMGVYAALCDAGVIDFASGLRLIRSAYEAIVNVTRGRSYSMGTLIGLNRQDIDRIVAQSGDELEITNQNSPFAFVISGDYTQVLRALEAAREEGALHTRQLNVNTPYHAAFLRDAALEFEKSVSRISFSPPSCPLLSLINAQELGNAHEIRQELTNNLYHPLNWFKTLTCMLEKGIETFIECGPSKGLVKNARFVEGKFRFLALDSKIV